MTGDIIKDGWCKDCEYYQPINEANKDCKHEAICKRAYRIGQIEIGQAIGTAVARYIAETLTDISIEKEQLETLTNILDIIWHKVLEGK